MNLSNTEEVEVAAQWVESDEGCTSLAPRFLELCPKRQPEGNSYIKAHSNYVKCLPCLLPELFYFS